MSRDNIIFDLHYSFYLENMFSTLMGRVDKTLSLLLIVLGGITLITSINEFVFGISVAILSAAQLIFQPGKQGGIASAHAKKYLRLISASGRLDNKMLLKQFCELQTLDSRPWRVLKHAAQWRATIVLDFPNTLAELTWWECTWSWLAGDLPKKEEYASREHRGTNG